MPVECRLQNNFYRQPIAIELYHIIVRNCKLVGRGQAEKKRFVLDLCFYKNITIGPTAWSNILWTLRQLVRRSVLTSNLGSAAREE